VTNQATGPKVRKRKTSLGLIDFDACQSITMDEAGVRLAAKAFAENEPYLPRPCSGDIHTKAL
jgi:hypothetical protein